MAITRCGMALAAWGPSRRTATPPAPPEAWLLTRAARSRCQTVAARSRISNRGFRAASRIVKNRFGVAYAPEEATHAQRHARAHAAYHRHRLLAAAVVVHRGAAGARLQGCSRRLAIPRAVPGRRVVHREGAGDGGARHRHRRRLAL